MPFGPSGVPLIVLPETLLPVPHVTSLDLPGLRFSPPSTAGDGARTKGTQKPDSYVAGSENRALVTTIEALLAGADGTGSERLAHRSPVSLIGPTGCGKSHLAQGIAAAWTEQLGDENVLCLTSTDLRRRLDEAIRLHTVAGFRDRVRSLRLLVIEDLHRTAAAPHFLEELTATLDDLRENGGLVLATSAKPFSEIRALDHSLISRFVAGLAVEIAPLSLESRAELLQQALTATGGRVEPAAATKVSATLSGDARRVLGTAAAMSDRFGRRPIGTGQAKQFLAEQAKGTSPPLREIAAAAGRYYKLPLRELRSSSRKQHVVLARSVAIFLARQLTPLSYEEIGQFFGGRDHTTIIHNNQKIESQLTDNRALRLAIEEVRTVVGRA